MIPFAQHLNLASAPLWLAVVAFSAAQGQTNDALELREAQTALQISSSRISSLENGLTKVQEQSRNLSDSLAAANSELQQTREAYEKLRIQMEGLGVAALDSSNNELQQRLLTALSDLRILEEQKRTLAEALMALSEASLTFSKSSGAETQKSLEQTLAASDKALGKLQNNTEAKSNTDFQNVSIVSIKEELGIAVFNIGSRHGVHAGMPFTIYRQDKPVGRALVVDVRNGICGAVVQELVNKDESVKVGDTAKVEAIKG